MEKILTYISDNQDLTRIGITSILNNYFNKNIEIKLFATKDMLFDGLMSEKPQIAIVDFDLLDLNDLSELTRINEISPSSGVIICTDNQSSDIVSKVLGLGFSVYILKSCLEQELIEAFYAALSNKKYFSSAILDLIINQRSKPKFEPDHVKLTTTELEIVRLITQGLTTKEIASQKFLSFHTVITHRKNIFRKLSIKSTSELMLYAMRNGIIDSLEYYI
jgi:DNA-binding NarL/FixJ family response regulator